MIVNRDGELADLLAWLAARADEIERLLVVWVDGWGRAAVEFHEREAPDVADEPPTPPLGSRRRAH